MKWTWKYQRLPSAPSFADSVSAALTIVPPFCQKRRSSVWKPYAPPLVTVENMLLVVRKVVSNPASVRMLASVGSSGGGHGTRESCAFFESAVGHTSASSWKLPVCAQ